MITAAEIQKPTESEINSFIRKETPSKFEELSEEKKNLIKQIAFKEFDKSNFSNLEYDNKIVVLKAAANFGYVDILDPMVLKEVHSHPGYLYANIAKFYSRLLLYAAEKGHIEVMNRVLSVAEIGLSARKKYSDHNLSTALELNRVLYIAASHGHKAIVELMIDLLVKEHQTFNKKMYIRSQATAVQVLSDNGVSPQLKRKFLLRMARQLFMRHQQEEFETLFDSIIEEIKQQIIFSVYGKKAPDEKINGELEEMFYTPAHTEIRLLLNAPIKHLPDGEISFVYGESGSDKCAYYYNMYRNEGILPLLETEIPALADAMGYEISIDCDVKTALTFSLESSNELKQKLCLHYNTNYVKALLMAEVYLAIFDAGNDQDWVLLPKEIWAHIGHYLVVLMSGIDPDETDKVFLFKDMELPKPTEFWMLGENNEVKIVEIPLDPVETVAEVKEKDSINKVLLFKTIYQALYKGQTSFFKQWNEALMSDDDLSEDKIKAYVGQNPESRSAEAWRLTGKFADKSNAHDLFKEVHQYAYKHSGFFKQTVFEENYENLNNRMNDALQGSKALEGSRTQMIFGELKANSSVKFW